MSFELNKLLCAFFTAVLVFLLASFLSELLYHTESSKDKKLSYYIEKANDNKPSDEKAQNKIEIKQVSEKEIAKLLKDANYEEGKKFVLKNCASCHDLNLPVKNKIGPSLAILLNRKIGSIEVC